MDKLGNIFVEIKIPSEQASKMYTREPALERQ